MRRIAFFGGGGLAKEIADVVSSNNFFLVGYFAPEIGSLDAEYLGEENNYKSADDIDGYFLGVHFWCQCLLVSTGED